MPLMHIAYSPPLFHKTVQPYFYFVFRFLASPYFDHDTFTHHAKHVVEADLVVQELTLP